MFSSFIQEKVANCDNIEFYSMAAHWQKTRSQGFLYWAMSEGHRKGQDIPFSRAWKWLCSSLGWWLSQEAQSSTAHLASYFCWDARCICRTKCSLLSL